MLKEKIYNLVEKGHNGSKVNLVFDYFIMSLIVLNVTALILESIPKVYDHYSQVLYIFEVVSVIIFTIEYVLRLYISDLTYPTGSRWKSVFKFMFSTFGLIDLLAILPFYLPFIITLDLRYLRALRLIRFVRIFKVNRYNKSLTIIADVIKDKKSELAMTGFVTLIILLIASFIMYNVEGEVQPDAFPNVLACVWWAVATLTTVGYGDVYPVTAVGKIIGSIIAILGIGVVALPAGIIGTGFMEKLGKKNIELTKCPHCGKEIVR